MKDLVVLVADRNQEAAIKALLGRPLSLGIRRVSYDLLVHPRHDPGCFREAHGFLRVLRGGYEHALVLFDASWEGAPSQDPMELEQVVRDRFGQAVVKDWADVIVIAPELEVWVWSNSPHVDEVLGWTGRDPSLRRWLFEENLWPNGMTKPPDPKRALERALRYVKVPRESRVYGKLASMVGVDRCTDASFERLRRRLVSWFPGERP